MVGRASAMSLLGTKRSTLKLHCPRSTSRISGKKRGGYPLPEAFKQVLAALYGGITTPAASAALTNELKGTGPDLLELGKDTTKKGLDETSRKIKGLFGK